MKILNYNIILRPEPEGGFTVLVPALHGCITYGKNVEEARHMAADAISAYIASLKKHREPIPSDNGNFMTLVSVRLPKHKSRVYA